MPRKHLAKKPAGAAKPNRSSQASAPNRDHLPPKDLVERVAVEVDSAMLTESTSTDPTGSITSYSVISKTGTKTGAVDVWGGDLVGRWLTREGILRISGWAIDSGAQEPASKVFLVKEAKILVVSDVSRKRPDVAESLCAENLVFCGWTLEIHGSQLEAGESELEMYALMTDEASVIKLGAKAIRVTSCQLVVPMESFQLDKIITKRLSEDLQRRKWPRMALDRVFVTGGTLYVKGWAVSPTGISGIKVYLNDAFAGLAYYGLDRPDVARHCPFLPEAHRSGFEFSFRLDPSEFTGTLTVRVKAFDKSGNTLKKELDCQLELGESLIC